MMLLKTRHSKDFHLLSAPLDHEKFHYVKTHPNYPEKRAKLAEVVGTPEFLWCADELTGCERDKPVEWEIECDYRVLGYVDDEKWNSYRDGGTCLPKGTFSLQPPDTSYSVLIDYSHPLSRDEVKRKAILDWDEHNQLVSRTEVPIEQNLADSP